MPELPEVEAWRRALDPDVKRHPIAQAGPAHIATLKTFDPPLTALAGARFAGASRRAKRLLFPSEDGELVLMVHLMSAGRIRYIAPVGKSPKSPAFRLRFEDGAELVLTEAGKRKRAGVWLLSPADLEAELAYLGPEADQLDASSLEPILASVPRRLHSLLRDQRSIAGIGRAWANEILHAAELSPYELSTQLWRARRWSGSTVGDPGGAGAGARAAPAGCGQRRDLPRPRQARRAVLALPRADRPGRLRGAHDLLLPPLPDRWPGAQGPAALQAAAMTIDEAHEATEELVEAIERLLPQLNEARTPPTLAQLGETVAGQTMLVARDDAEGAIVGTLTLVLYRVPSGLKGRIEDVIVDSSARGQGVGEALMREGMARANAAPVLMLELSSMPYRETANRLYKRLGFVRRPTNVYVWWPR